LGIPVLVGIIISLAGLPFYRQITSGCNLMPKPFNDSNEVYFLEVIPILLTILLSISLQALVYLNVRKQVRASWRWSFGTSTNSFSLSSTDRLAKNDTSGEKAPEVEHRDSVQTNTMGVLTSTNVEAAVFWQAAFYVFVLLISWPMVVASILFARYTVDIFAFWAVFVYLAPIQGFLNCMVYIRPRVMKWRPRRCLEKRRKQQECHKARKKEVEENLELDTAWRRRLKRRRLVMRTFRKQQLLAVPLTK